jgi:hypothetical protein
MREGYRRAYTDIATRRMPRRELVGTDPARVALAEYLIFGRAVSCQFDANSAAMASALKEHSLTHSRSGWLWRPRAPMAWVVQGMMSVCGIMGGSPSASTLAA